MSAAVRQIVVVGRDAAAWMAALGLRRALGRSGVEVRLIELPSLLHPADAISTVPSLNGLLRMLGLDQSEVLARCAGVPVLGQRFANWSRSAPPFVHAYDVHRPALDNVDFFQFWIKARSAGLRVAWEDFSVAAAAAKQGRVAPKQVDPESLSALSHGYHIDARAFVALLRERALKLGVLHHVGGITSVEREWEQIRAVLLGDGQRIEGDLFVDATGADALLLGSQPGAEFGSWSRWLPCDRLLAASGPALNALPSFAQISAFRSGWVGLFPLQDRTAVVTAFQSADAGDGEMLENAATIAGMPLGGDAVASELRPGMQVRPWIGNCVALGDAAIALEPLDGVSLHGTHIGLTHLVALFPVESEAMPEAGKYNELVASHARNVRDFQIAHYQLNQRFDEPMWDQAREAAPPDLLAARIGLFAARGEIPQLEHDTFEGQNWTSMLIGHGVMPRDYDPRVDASPQSELIEKFQRLLGVIAGEVKAMPTVDVFLGRTPPPSAH